ncbi:hypothetical protein [Cecembia rubra]|nr:hypothetical protein [Cecembia rubra]
MKKINLEFIVPISIKRTISVFCTIVLCFFGISAEAQSFKKMAYDRNHSLALGFGPSVFYGENGGNYRSLQFPVKPSITLAYSKRLSDHLQLRLTGGQQGIKSWDRFKQNTIENWALSGVPYAFRGSAFFIDIMPQFMLFPSGYLGSRSQFNVYGGLGVGAVFVNREQRVYSANGDIATKVNTTSAYIPVRAGIIYGLSYLYNIGLEGTFMNTFSDELDGNSINAKRNDHLMQLNFTLTRYF